VDPNAALAALRSGQIDLIQRAPTNTVQLAKATGFKVVLDPGPTVQGFILDHLGKVSPAFGDVRVRQALNFAVNRKKYLALYGPGALATSNPINNQKFDGSYPEIEQYYTYNPAKARALLAAAGYPNGFTFPALCTGAWAGPDQTEALCAAISQDFAAVGVKMDITTPGANDLGTELGSGKYSIWWIGGALAPAWAYYGLILGPKPILGDQHGWRDPALDRLWLKGQRAAPREARKIWRQFTLRVTSEGVSVALVAQVYYTFVSKRVGGVYPAQVIALGLSDPITWFPTRP
jgi:peptide/nickel transport system substrate-binding protein